MTPSWKAASAFGLILMFLCPLLPLERNAGDEKVVRVAGIQFEFVIPAEIRSALDDAVKKLPHTDIFVLSEYSFDGPVPGLIKKWCRDNHKYLLAGGKDILRNGNFYNLAYVIGPDGSVIFHQAKCVPVQLMKDGLPASHQELWDSPWGKIGICICYDASYTRVADVLVRQGASALLIPTMDVADWGARQHELHGRIGPMRAAEYGLPVFRVCSSGISQIINKKGEVTATAPFPGPGAVIAGEMIFPQEGGRVPPDRLLAVAATILTGLLAFWLTFLNLVVKKK